MVPAYPSEYAELQRNPSANPANYTVRTSELSMQISDTADALRKAEEDYGKRQREWARECKKLTAAGQPCPPAPQYVPPPIKD